MLLDKKGFFPYFVQTCVFCTKFWVSCWIKTVSNISLASVRSVYEEKHFSHVFFGFPSPPPKKSTFVIAPRVRVLMREKSFMRRIRGELFPRHTRRKKKLITRIGRTLSFFCLETDK